MLRVVPGLPMDGRGERLLVESLADDRGRGHLHVVRTRARERALHDLELTGSFRFGSTVVTLSDLVSALAPRRTRVRAAMGDAERALFLDEIARGEAGPPLRGVAGLAAWLGKFFSRLKQGDVFSVEHALDRFRSLRADDPGTREALRLFSLYQARLVDLGMYDEDGLYIEVARDLGTEELPFDRLQPSRRRLVVEGFYQTNVVERAIFARLFAGFEETLWLVDLPPGVPVDAFGLGVLADHEIKGLRLQGDLAWLAARGAQAEDGPIEAPPAAASPSAIDWAWTSAIERRTEFVVASDERAEARFLAERAAALVRSAPEATVVIAFPSDRQAVALMQEACADVELPLEVAASRTLAESAHARMLLGLLALSSRDFARDRVVAALRGAARGAMLGGVRVDASIVDRVSRNAGVVAGAASWRRKLDRLLARLARDLASAPAEADRARIERKAAEAGQVRIVIGALLDLIPAPDATSTTAEFSRIVRDAIERFVFVGTDQVPPGPLDQASIDALAMGARSRTALDAIVETYERSALRRHDGRPWADHVAALGVLVGATIVPLPPPMAMGARLVGMRELRGLVTDHLLVGGLTEGAFPGAMEPAPLLSEADAALAGAHSAQARRREAEHLLVQALWSPRKSLVLSRPEQCDGVEALPALALEAIRERAGMPEIGTDDVLARGPVRGRTARGRRAAAALADVSIPVAEAEARFQSVVEAGADADLAWHRLRAERERHDRTRVGRFEGMLEEGARGLLLPDSAEIRMSASRFEDYVKCPLLYFFKRVLKLGPAEETDPDVTALDRGSALHRILYRFHREVAAAGSPRGEWARTLDRMAREELGKLRYDGLFAEVFLDDLTRDLVSPGESRRPGLLRRYLEHEEQRKTGFQPRYFEARFGPSPRGEASDTVLSEDPIPLFQLDLGDRRVEVTLTGSIDRVDLMEEGPDLLALVLDYKTGDVSGNRSRAERGQLFQLPLYSRVLAQLLAPDLGGRTVRPIAAAYYQLRSSSEVGIDEPLVERGDLGRIGTPSLRKTLPVGGFAQLLDGYARRARDVVLATLDGRFHPTAMEGYDNHCRRCDFAHVCRGNREAPRLARLKDAGLFPQVEDLVPRERKQGS